MLGAFKDVFGKKAADLHKKEFSDGQKYTLKSQTADGVKFEGSTNNKGEKGEMNLNFKDGEMEVKNKLAVNGKFTIDASVFKVADGLDATFVLETATKANEGVLGLFSKAVLGGKYATADLNFENSLSYDGVTPSFNAAVVAKVMDDVNAGASLTGFTFGEEGVKGKMDLALSHICKEFQIAAHFNGEATGKAFDPTSMSASFWQQTTADTAVGATFSCDTATKVGLVLGTECKLCSANTVKAKVTAVPGGRPTVDLAWIRKFEGATVSLSQTLPADSSSKFGLGLTIDA